MTYLSCVTFSRSLSSSAVVSFNCVNSFNLKFINLPLELEFLQYIYPTHAIAASVALCMCTHADLIVLVGMVDRRG